LGRVDNTAPVGKPCRPPEDCPSSNSNALPEISFVDLRFFWLMLTKATPDVTVVRVEFENASQVFHGLWELLTCSQNMGNGVHCRDRPLVVP
jgi:hypothetical protein